MRAVKILLAMVMTCVLFCAQGIAISEESATTPPLRHILDISLSSEPDCLVEGGEVILTFEIKNDSQFGADNLYFSFGDGEQHERLGQIPAGDMQIFTRSYEVSEEELDAGILEFTVVHDDISKSGETVDYEVSTAIEKVEPYADVEFIRRISSPKAVEGAQVTITYRVKNTGNVPVEEVWVEDELGEFSAGTDILNCGEEKIFTNHIVFYENMVSEAHMEYRAPLYNDKTHKTQLADAEITVSEPGITAELVLNSETPENGHFVEGVVNITALGSSFRDIIVEDDVNGVLIADCLEIAEDETVSIACSWPVRKPADYRLSVSGVAETGARFNTVSNTISMGLSGEFSENDLNITAQAATPVISRPGLVRIMVSITNDGNSAARDVVLRETGMGDIREFAFIPTGDPTYREVMVDVQEDTVFEFCVCRKGEDGVLQTAAAVAVPVTISDDGAEPETADDGTDKRFFSWIGRNISDEATYTRLLAVAAAVLGILVLIAVISHSREYMKKRHRRARKNRRRTGEGEKTPRSK